MIEQLETLGGQALMRPYTAQRSSSGYYELNSGSGLHVAGGLDKPDAQFIAAAVNALPVLLRMVKAAQQLRAADDMTAPGGSLVWQSAVNDLYAALDALDLPTVGNEA